MRKSILSLFSLIFLASGFIGCGNKVNAKSENTEELCHDSIDNDDDGFVDCDDQDCEAYCSVPENDPMLCSDGYDNDSDGLIDCNDPDCSAFCTDASVDVPADVIDDREDGVAEVVEATDPQAESELPPDAADAAEDMLEIVDVHPEEDSVDTVDGEDAFDAGEDAEEDAEEDEDFDVTEEEACIIGFTGDPCLSASHCACVPSSARECLANLSGYITFNGGYCSARCTSSSECGENAACAEITVGSRYCLKLCSSASQCRMTEGYTCQTIPMSSDTRTYCLPAAGSEPDL